MKSIQLNGCPVNDQAGYPVINHHDVFNVDGIHQPNPGLKRSENESGRQFHGVCKIAVINPAGPVSNVALLQDGQRFFFQNYSIKFHSAAPDAAAGRQFFFEDGCPKAGFGQVGGGNQT